jgi:ribose transport system substrate-binding protein
MGCCDDMGTCATCAANVASNTTTVSSLINKAIDAGIKVLTWDGDAPNSKRLTYYGMDHYQAGKTFADLFNKLLGGTGKIIVVSPAFSPPSASHTARMMGLQDQINANYPGLSIVDPAIECGTAQEKDATTALCTKLIDPALAKTPDATGFFFSRGLPLRQSTKYNPMGPDLATNAPNFTAAVKAGTIKVVGLDSTPDELANMQAGLIHALIGQKYFGWGYDVVTLSYNMLTLNQAVEPFTDSQFDVVCPNNLNETVANWMAQDFRKQLTACSTLK